MLTLIIANTLTIVFLIAIIIRMKEKMVYLDTQIENLLTLYLDHSERLDTKYGMPPNLKN